MPEHFAPVQPYIPPPPPPPQPYPHTLVEADPNKVYAPQLIASGSQAESIRPITTSKLDGIIKPDVNANAQAYFEFARKMRDNASYRPDSTQLTDFAIGFVKGFFVDGLWGNVTGLVDVAKFLWNNPLVGLNPFARISTEDALRYWNGDFSKEREQLDGILEIVGIVAEVANQVSKTAMDEVQSELNAIMSGDPDELEALADKHKQLAAFAMQLAADLWDAFVDLSAEEKGRIFGAIFYEVLQEVILAFISGGSANVATGAAKVGRFTSLLSKMENLADAGELPARLKRLLPGVDVQTLVAKLKSLLGDQKYARMFSKFELIEDAAESTKVAKMVTGGCFIASTRVARFANLTPRDISSDNISLDLPDVVTSRLTSGLLVGAGFVMGVGAVPTRRKRRKPRATEVAADSTAVEVSLFETMHNRFMFHYYVLAASLRL
jgi:hypothetical protein